MWLGGGWRGGDVSHENRTAQLKMFSSTRWTIVYCGLSVMGAVGGGGGGV